ncbi:MAG: hypothetical protein V3U59_09545 [Gammaproteobacteria bacterium]
MAEESPDLDLSMEAESLYQEELFTDRRVGTIQRLTPVTRDGGPDKSRPVKFVGQTQILTPAGSLPVSFEIEASSLGEAAKRFGEAGQQAVEDTLKKLQELQREMQSSIVLPETGAGGIGPGSLGGGGKIQMP